MPVKIKKEEEEGMGGVPFFKLLPGDKAKSAFLKEVKKEEGQHATIPPVSPTPKKATFQVESDLHFEQSTNATEYSTYDFPHTADFLLLAGDIGRVNPMGGVDHAVLYQNFLRRMGKHYKHIFLIEGNNEPRGREHLLADSNAKLKAFELNNPKLTFLEEKSYDMSKFGLDITILGCALWSKIRADAASGTSDGNNAWKGNSTKEHNARYEKSIKWIRSEVLRIRKERPSHRIIIMTHHAPSIRGTCQQEEDSSREYFSGPTAGLQFSGYANDLLGGEGIAGLQEGDVWAFGHTHYSCRFKQDEVLVVANQRGGGRNDTKLAGKIWDPMTEAWKNNDKNVLATRYKKGGCTITV